MRKYRYTKTKFGKNGKRFITHTTRFKPKRKKWNIKEVYLSGTLLDKFKLYRHKYKKSRYIKGFNSDIEYVPPIVSLSGFRRK